MEISSSLLLEQPVENEVLVTPHLLQLSLFLWGKAPRFPPYFPLLRFSLPNLVLIYSNHTTAVPAQGCHSQGHHRQAQHPQGQPSHSSGGASSAAQGWHPAASVPQGASHARDGLCARPSNAPGVLQNRAAPRPCALCCQEESLACADRFLSALKILLD